MNVVREIPKEVEPPHLSSWDVELISDLLFGRQNVLPFHDCDAILVFGTSSQFNHVRIATEFKRVLSDSGARTVYITGGVTNPGTVSEAASIIDAINRQSTYPGIRFILEKDSTNTLENVRNAIRLGLSGHYRILFITKSPHCGRCRLTLQKHLPDSTFFRCGYDPVLIPGIEVTRNNWVTMSTVRRLIWGEFLRIESYGIAGHIAYPKPVRDLVTAIRISTGFGYLL